MSWVVIGTVGAVALIAIAVGVVKVGKDMYRWGVDQTRDKKPWERNPPHCEL